MIRLLLVLLAAPILISLIAVNPVIGLIFNTIFFVAVFGEGNRIR